jgi:hypothetical protein
MTTHVRDSAAPSGHASPLAGAAEPRRSTTSRARWLMPVLVGGVTVGILVVAGVLPISAVLIGGCLLMHVFGHRAHGGHGRDRSSRWDREEADADVLTGRSEDLRQGSGDSQRYRAPSERGPNDGAPATLSTVDTTETTANVHNRSHACH